MNQKTIIALIVVIIGIAIPGYFLLTSSPKVETSSQVVSSSDITNDAEAQFVTLSAQLVPLSFDTSILTDPRFTSLVDLHTIVLPEAIGRRDPFAPLGR